MIELDKKLDETVEIQHHLETVAKITKEDIKKKEGEILNIRNRLKKELAAVEEMRELKEAIREIIKKRQNPRT